MNGVVDVDTSDPSKGSMRGGGSGGGEAPLGSFSSSKNPSSSIVTLSISLRSLLSESDDTGTMAASAAAEAAIGANAPPWDPLEVLPGILGS